MSNIKSTIANEKLLQKASAVKFGWIAMEADGRWYWFAKKPRWSIDNYWRCDGCFAIANVKFLKLPKRRPSFAPLSLIKCTSRGPILLSIGKQYHRTWGMISIETANNINYLSKRKR